MKKLLFSVILLITTLLASFGQNDAVDAVFDKYALQPGFETVSVSGDLLEMMQGVDSGLDDLNIGNIKILTVEDPALNAQLNFYDEIVPNLALNDYTRLLDLDEGGEQVVILKKKNGMGLQEFILITGGGDNTLIYIEGDINLAALGKISQALEFEEPSF